MYNKKEHYQAEYRRIDEWGNAPRNLPMIEAKDLDSCSACKTSGLVSACACNRLSSDMSDPYRKQYPITPPAPYQEYELPGQVCPKCMQIVKNNLY